MGENKRIEWEDYFFNIAFEVAKRSACHRNHVGAVIVKDNIIISTGYNGAPRFQDNCQEKGFCYREKNQIKSGTNLELCRAVGSHAESNAIAHSARFGRAIDGASIYIVGHSCICNQCKAQIVNSGIITVYLKKTKEEKCIIQCPEYNWNVHPIDERKGE